MRVPLYPVLSLLLYGIACWTSEWEVWGSILGQVMEAINLDNVFFTHVSLFI